MHEKIEKLLQIITEKKELLDSYRPLPKALVQNLEEWFNIELTYTSNALEGNTLTKSETAIVIEKGITIGGKTIREHLEAINHAHALDFIHTLVHLKKEDFTLNDIRTIHGIILQGIDDAHAGAWRTIQVKLSHSPVQLPAPTQVPMLMQDFLSWLHSVQDHPAAIAAQAHYLFVAIHPFIDGNGRTGRLLMNLLLMQYGYPPAAIQKEERADYINALEKIDQHKDFTDFNMLIYKAIERSLDMYIEFAEKSIR